jgi:hypothetical protein
MPIIEMKSFFLALVGKTDFIKYQLSRSDPNPDPGLVMWKKIPTPDPAKMSGSNRIPNTGLNWPETICADQQGCLDGVAALEINLDAFPVQRLALLILGQEVPLHLAAVQHAQVAALRHRRVQGRLRDVILHYVVKGLGWVRAGEADGGLGAAVPHLHTGKTIRKQETLENIAGRA